MLPPTNPREWAMHAILDALNVNRLFDTFAATEFIVDKLIAYGIHPNAIKVAFTEKVAPDE